MWHDLWVAFALLLVIEGVWPFLNPERMRKAMSAITNPADHSLRVAGLVRLLVGVGLLYLIN